MVKIGDFIVILEDRAHGTDEKKGAVLRVTKVNTYYEFNSLTTSHKFIQWNFTHNPGSQKWRAAEPHEIPWFEVFYG